MQIILLFFTTYMYSVFIDLMEESDEEFEEQLRTAIAASLADHSTSSVG